MTGHTKNGRVALGLSAMLSVGLLAVELAPAAAAPWNRNQVRRTRNDRNRNDRYDTRRERVLDRADQRNDRFGRFSDRGDWDYDGIPNHRDNDSDGDGVPDRRDSHPFNTDRA